MYASKCSERAVSPCKCEGVVWLQRDFCHLCVCLMPGRVSDVRHRSSTHTLAWVFICPFEVVVVVVVMMVVAARGGTYLYYNPCCNYS